MGYFKEVIQEMLGLLGPPVARSMACWKICHLHPDIHLHPFIHLFIHVQSLSLVIFPFQAPLTWDFPLEATEVIEDIRILLGICAAPSRGSRLQVRDKVTDLFERASLPNATEQQKERQAVTGCHWSLKKSIWKSGSNVGITWYNNIIITHDWEW